MYFFVKICTSVKMEMRKFEANDIVSVFHWHLAMLCGKVCLLKYYKACVGLWEYKPHIQLLIRDYIFNFLHLLFLHTCRVTHKTYTLIVPAM